MSDSNHHIILNEQGLFIPRALFDRADEIVQELRQEGKLSSLKTRPPLAKVRRVPVKDRTKEMQWLKEHRHEYRGEWVALDGDRLLAHGTNAKEVFASAREIVSDPLFEFIAPDYDLPFGGW